VLFQLHVATIKQRIGYTSLTGMHALSNLLHMRCNRQGEGVGRKRAYFVHVYMQLLLCIITGVSSSSQCSNSADLNLILRSRPVRQKRLRTSFKHHELRIMKSYFSLNHNPDAKDLKQLSIKTGLSKRVLQVYSNSSTTLSLCK